MFPRIQSYLIGIKSSDETHFLISHLSNMHTIRSKQRNYYCETDNILSLESYIIYKIEHILTHGKLASKKSSLYRCPTNISNELHQQ